MQDVSPSRLTLARFAYGAYESGDRSVLEHLLAADFTFYSPYDDGIDRATYFDRCWPNHETTESFEYKRLLENGDDEVIVTYELTKSDGKRFCNTEVLTFDFDKLRKSEVYFGWDVK